MTLLEPSFMRELEALRRRVRVRPRSGAVGERIASRRGSSAEFLEHRPYAPGDELRRMDWAAFGRTGEPTMKVFRAEEEVVVRLIVDASASLSFGDPPKIDVAKRLAAAIGYLALSGSERTELRVLDGGEERPKPELRGRGALGALLRDLDRHEAAGKTTLARALADTVRRAHRPGLLVLVSDFFDATPLESSVLLARSRGHDVALVQVLAQEEVAPPWEGDVALEDAETSTTVEVTLDDHVVSAYLARLNALFASLAALAKKVEGTYVRHVSRGDPVETMRRFVARSVD